MTGELKMKAQWDQARGRIKEAWGALTDDDLDRTEGKWERLVGTIREKTGDSIETIEKKLNEFFDRAKNARN